MIQLPMLLQAYSPGIHLGDWQIVVFVNRRRKRIVVERWHSSEKHGHPQDNPQELLRIDTGIRAFRRQMPVLAAALDTVDSCGMSDEEIVEAVFRVLASVYQAAPERDELLPGDHSPTDGELADFIEWRKQCALAALVPGSLH